MMPRSTAERTLFVSSYRVISDYSYLVNIKYSVLV